MVRNISFEGSLYAAEPSTNEVNVAFNSDICLYINVSLSNSTPFCDIRVWNMRDIELALSWVPKVKSVGLDVTA